MLSPEKNLENEHKVGISIHGVLSSLEPKHSFHLNSAFHSHSTANSLTTKLLHLSEVSELNNGLPRWLIVNADNFSADNKSKLLFKFWMWLVSLDIIDGVVLLFMPPGHTHGAVDAIFGVISQEMEQAKQLNSVEDLKKVFQH